MKNLQLHFFYTGFKMSTFTDADPGETPHCPVEYHNLENGGNATDMNTGDCQDEQPARKRRTPQLPIDDQYGLIFKMIRMASTGEDNNKSRHRFKQPSAGGEELWKSMIMHSHQPACTVIKSGSV